MDAATQKQQQQGGCLSPSSAVASSLNNSPYVQLGPIEVPKALQDGEKFIKWDEVSCVASRPQSSTRSHVTDYVLLLLLLSTGT